MVPHMSATCARTSPLKSGSLVDDANGIAFDVQRYMLLTVLANGERGAGVARKKPYTTTEAASELTKRGFPADLRAVQRLCDGGDLRCVKTPGGVRRIPVSALEDYWHRLQKSGRITTEHTLSTGEAATYLTKKGIPVSPMTVRRWCDQGVLRCLPSVSGKQRRVLQSALDEYLAAIL